MPYLSLYLNNSWLYH